MCGVPELCRQPPESRSGLVAKLQDVTKAHGLHGDRISPDVVILLASGGGRLGTGVLERAVRQIPTLAPVYLLPELATSPVVDLLV